MADIVITDRIYSDTVAHCRREWPKEACGALFGEPIDETTMRITGSLALANVAGDPHRHFQIDPREWIPLLSRTGEFDFHPSKLVGIYHSHPRTPGEPSAEDLDTAWRRLPCFLIVSLQNPNDPNVQAFGFEPSPVGYRKFEIIRL